MGQVIVVDPAFGVPLVPTAMAQAAATAASLGVAPYALTVFDENDSLPVISIEAAAPDRSHAQRLAEAAVAVLESQASPGGPVTFRSRAHLAPRRRNLHRGTDGKVSRLQAFVVGQIAPVRVKLLPATALPLQAIGVSFFMFLTWCAGVLLLPGLTRGLRSRGRTLPA